jgi:hypothetical protein
MVEYYPDCYESPDEDKSKKKPGKNKPKDKKESNDQTGNSKSPSAGS